MPSWAIIYSYTFLHHLYSISLVKIDMFNLYSVLTQHFCIAVVNGHNLLE